MRTNRSRMQKPIPATSIVATPGSVAVRLMRSINQFDAVPIRLRRREPTRSDSHPDTAS